MVVLELKKVLFVSLFLVIVFSGLSSAQIEPEGCCCVDEPSASYYYGINETECQTYNYLSFSTTPADDDECSQLCAPAEDCSFLSCEDENIDLPCMCGDVLANAGFCCASDPSINVFADQTSCEASSVCAPSFNSYLLSGYVFDTHGDTVSGASVIAGSFTEYTDSNGFYSLIIPESDSITVRAGAPNCVESSTNIPFIDNYFLNFTITCDVELPECPGICCGSNSECVDGSPSSGYDCAAGYLCYVGCNAAVDSCEAIDITEQDCTYQECSTTANAYCTAESVWLMYDISESGELDAYCALCSYDADCINRPCESDSACNGECPVNCGPGEDPDCGYNCDIDSSQWCGPGVSAWTSSDYCNYCSLQDPFTCCSGPDCCGDGEVQSHEQCDDGNTIDYDTCHNDCSWNVQTGCVVDGTRQAVESCDPNVDFDFDPTNYWETICPESSIGCDNQCNCIPPCNTDQLAPMNLGIGHIPETNKIRLTWDLPTNSDCTSEWDYLKIYRCIGESCEEGSSFFSRPSEGITFETSVTHFDDDVSANILYTYYVSLFYQNGDEESSDSIDIISGDSDCFQPRRNYFCLTGLNERFHCDTNNALTNASCAGDCYQPVDINDDAFCVGSGACQDCNSFYGMFGQFSLDLGTSGFTDFWVTYTADVSSNPTTYSCALLKNDKVCFMEQTTKSVDMLQSCSDVDSCYDYKAADTCIAANPCGKFLEDETFGCEWSSFEADSDFGLGVCHPKDLDLQECGLCTTEENPIFPVCNFDLCNLFGDCYYSDYNAYFPDDSTTACYGFADITCEEYDDATACTGDQVFSLDPMNNPTFSDDHFNFSKCKWDGGAGRCYRDADDNADSIPGPLEIGKIDCQDADLICKKDFESPVTTMDVVDGDTFGRLLEIPLLVSDNVYEAGNITTYYCLSQNAAPCEIAELYDEEAELVGDVLYINKTFLESNNQIDTYLLNYYSADAAKNLEAVKTVTINVDAKKPSLIDFEYYYESAEITSLSILQTSFVFDEFVTCSINLTDHQGNIQTPIVNGSYGTEFLIDYEPLEDGLYTFNLNCVDDNNNRANNETVYIKVEADSSINGVYPFENKFYNREHKISVNTTNFAECRYSTETFRFSNMTNEIEDQEAHRYQGVFDTNNGNHHYKNINFSYSGVYRLFTACNISLEDGTVWNVTEGNDGDWIVLSVDRIPPITMINRLSPDPLDDIGTLEFDRYYQDIELEFSCEEQPYFFDHNGNVQRMETEYWDGSFGCEQIFFCDEEACILEPTGQTREYTVEYDDEEETNHPIYFQSKDSSDEFNKNKETRRNFTVLIDPNPATLELIVTKNNVSVDTLTYGTYKLTFTSTKSIAGVARLSYIIYYGDGSTSEPIAMVNQVPNDLNEYDFSVFMTLDSGLFYDQQGHLTFTVAVEDTHGMQITEFIEKNFYTIGPPAPFATPIFNPLVYQDIPMGSGLGYKDAYDYWYPFVFYEEFTSADDDVYNNIHIIREPQLFITGYSEEMQGEILFFLIEGVYDGFVPRYIYNQLTSDGVEWGLNKKTLKQNTAKGSDYVMINTTQMLTSNWAPGTYVNFHGLSDNIGRTDYENYGKFYLIIESTFLGPSLGHRINFTPSLQEDLTAGMDVYLFNNSHYYQWFGKEISLEYSPAGDNLYSLVLGLNDSLNVGLSEEILLFVDTAAPIATYINPSSGSIQDNQPIIIEFKEQIGGSGLKEDSLRFTIYQDEVPYVKTLDNGLVLTELQTAGDYREYKLEYVPESGWENAAYNVSINVEDNAGNKIDTSEFFDGNLLFVVDGRIPSTPSFSVNDATADNIDSAKRTVIDNNQPVFLLDFTMNSNGSIESLDITTPVVTLTDYVTSATITCLEDSITNNLFSCSFNNALVEGLYSFTASATNIFPNGSLGPAGIFSHDVSGNALSIIVDNTAPSFTLQPENLYLQPNEPVAIFADVTNEQFDLLAQVEVQGQERILQTERIDNEYLIIIPADFEWGNEGLKTIYVTLEDYAGHQTSGTTTVTLDMSPPAILITSLEADRGFLIPNTANGTVGQREIIIRGIVDDDTNALCYQQTGGGEVNCIYECTGGVENCIQRLPGDDIFEFNLIVNGSNSFETLNTIILTLTDYSGWQTTSSLYILLDLEAPHEPEITFLASE